MQYKKVYNLYMKITQYKTLENFLKAVQEKNEVNFIFTQKMAYRYENKIFINRSIPYEAKIFLIAHEFAHIINGEGKENKLSNFSSKLEQEDKDAIKMLNGISENENEHFNFKNLYKMNFFEKLKGI